VGVAGFSTEGSGASFHQWLEYNGDLLIVQSPTTTVPVVRLYSNPGTGPTGGLCGDLSGLKQRIHGGDSIEKSRVVG